MENSWEKISRTAEPFFEFVVVPRGGGFGATVKIWDFVALLMCFAYIWILYQYWEAMIHYRKY